eukprot:Skav215363  [mRNA]  locus=scaffold1391:601446:607256:- [translate_table: standard]
MDQQNFYAILAGSCEVLRDNKVVAQLSTGDSFGEAGLLLKAPSPVSFKASSDLQLLVMKGQVFCELMKKTNFALYGAMEEAAQRYGMSFQEVARKQEDGRKRVRHLLQHAVESAGTEIWVDVDRLLGTAGVLRQGRSGGAGLRAPARAGAGPVQRGARRTPGGIDGMWRLSKAAIPSSLATRVKGQRNHQVMRSIRVWQWRWFNSKHDDLLRVTGQRLLKRVVA